VLPPSSRYKSLIPVYETTWHYILKGLYLKASAHNSELNGTEMTKGAHHHQNLVLLTVLSRLVPGGKVLLKQVVEDVSGVTKIIHNLKDNT